MRIGVVMALVFLFTGLFPGAPVTQAAEEEYTFAAIDSVDTACKVPVSTCFTLEGTLQNAPEKTRLEVSFEPDQKDKFEQCRQSAMLALLKPGRFHLVVKGAERYWTCRLVRNVGQ